MQHFVWAFIASSLIAVPTVKADQWEKLINDLDLYEQTQAQDEADSQLQLYDASINNGGELFPLLPGEEEITEGTQQPNSLSDSHVVIEADDVSVVLDDVPVIEWFAEYVEDAASRNLISGYRDAEGVPTGKFGPADNVTIEQLAKMANIAAKTDIYSCGDTTKNETSLGGWSDRYIRCAEHNGWAVFSDGSVDVLRSATRTEVVVTVLQAFGVRISPFSGTVFSDVISSTVFGNAIETAAGDGIVSSYSNELGNPTGLFGPTDFVNRAETAKIFSMSFRVYGTP
ncbi:MAG: S-layer homology domain-containing protein [Candidatus Peribacteraceae bacterium]|nr:S-layer homology domain-containing protein [Candidatus Peribacteraceae bacterium]